MQPGGNDSSTLANKPLSAIGESKPFPSTETQEEMDQRLLALLGEVIRRSQGWVRALESGDPIAADKHEAKCVAAMERFEANRKKVLSRPDSLERTR
jgi:hypothetical protein